MKPKYFIFFLLSIPFFLFISQNNSITITTAKSSPVSIPDLKIRPRHTSYDNYIQCQLNKTLNPKLRELWKTRDWTRKIRVFSEIFNDLEQNGLLSNSSKALCIGARMGQEVEALKRVGVTDSIGIDLVPSPPLVVGGDFHHQPFDNETFDFEFSNVFDHALYPEKFSGDTEAWRGLCFTRGGDI